MLKSTKLKFIRLNEYDFQSFTAINIVLVMDENLSKIYSMQLQDIFRAKNKSVKIVKVPVGERAKSRQIKAKVEDQMLIAGCDKNTLIIAFGGGVVTDLVGFIAATFYRGIDVIYIPTSLIAMVDASIGGKCAINTDYGKNLLGIIRNPNLVLVDPDFLLTLPDIEFFSAMSEVIKHAIIISQDYFLDINSNINKVFQKDQKFILRLIQNSQVIKDSIIQKDQNSLGIRNILNFGHNFAHALEAVTNFKINHGTAVAYGIIAESYISFLKGKLKKIELQEIERLIKKFILCPLPAINNGQVLGFIAVDKKNSGQRKNFILINKIGSVYMENGSYLHEVSDEIILTAIDYLKSFSRQLCL